MTHEVLTKKGWGRDRGRHRGRRNGGEVAVTQTSQESTDQRIGRRATASSANLRVKSRQRFAVADYMRLEQVGKGTFATCFKARHGETGIEACMKVVDLCAKKIDVPDVKAELQFLNRLDHPNCLNLYAFDVNINLEVTMMVEFCPLSLEDVRIAKDPKESIRTRIEFGNARQCMFQILKGVDYIHKLEIAHFDLKADNVLITEDGTLKLADFGLAVALPKGALVTDGMYRGTEEFMAPEVNDAHSGYGLKADVWSLGVVFYELIFGVICKPVRESFPRRLHEALRKSALLRNFDVALVGVFTMCFKEDVDERATIEELANHHLFKSTYTVSRAAVKSEIALTYKLAEKLKTVRQQFVSDGALPDLDLEDSSDESSDSESETENENESLTTDESETNADSDNSDDSDGSVGCEDDLDGGDTVIVNEKGKQGYEMAGVDVECGDAKLVEDEEEAWTTNDGVDDDDSIVNNDGKEVGDEDAQEVVEEPGQSDAPMVVVPAKC